MDDLQRLLEAIFIRVGEAWEVLGKAKSRAAYEARLPSGGPHLPERPDAEGHDSESSHGASSEDTLRRAQELVDEERYWDAIRLLESAVPRLTPPQHQHRGRILLARAYGHNPKWVHRAEETLHTVVREDPTHADAHYELGLLYKRGGLNARAQAMFRKATQLRPHHHQAAAEIRPAAPAPTGGFLRRLFGGGKRA